MCVFVCVCVCVCVCLCACVCVCVCAYTRGNLLEVDTMLQNSALEIQPAREFPRHVAGTRPRTRT
jgi:hypothetical protein